MKNAIMTACLTGLLGLAGLTPLHSLAGDDATGRLARIQETGVLVAGFRETAVPFSYLDPQQPAGFGVELTRRIGDAIKRHLGRDDLRIRWNAVSPSTRVPLMTTGTLDILCATDTPDAELAAQVGFSRSYFVSEAGAVVARSRTLDPADVLKGMRVAIAANAAIGARETEVLTEGASGIRIIHTPTNRRAMRLVQTGEADAFVSSAALAAGEQFRLGDAERFQVVSLGGTQYPLACMLPAGDVAFKGLVDAALEGLMASGEMAALYDKWFLQPIPPFGKAINLPLNEATRALYATPR